MQPFIIVVIVSPGMPVDVLVQHAEVPEPAVRESTVNLLTVPAEPAVTIGRDGKPRRFWFDRNECGVLRSRLEN